MSVTSLQLCDSCHEVLAQPPRRQRLRFSGGLLAVLHVDYVALHSELSVGCLMAVFSVTFHFGALC